VAAAAIMAAALPAAAQTVDPSGTWDLTFSTDQGPIAARMVIHKDGDAYVGTIASELGEADLQADVKGQTMSAGFTMAMSDGASLAVTLTSTITGDDIKGTYDAGGSGAGDFSGKRTAKAEPAAPVDPVDVTGNYDVQVVTSTISANPSLALKQQGDKVTGDYESAQYGKFPLTGTVKGNKVELAFSMTIEGNTIDVSLAGTADKDGIKGDIAYGEFAQGTFTATKKSR
jgi:hypothetical protein